MQCRYIKHDGSECWANAMENSEYCWFHAPEIDYDRRNANSKGGKAKRAGLYADLPAIHLKTIDDVPEALIDTIRQVRGGFIGVRLGTAIAYITGMLIKSFSVTDLDKRVKKMGEFTKKSLSIINERLEKLEAKEERRSKMESIEELINKD
jgi:hypothetical protein